MSKWTKLQGISLLIIAGLMFFHINSGMIPLLVILINAIVLLIK